MTLHAAFERLLSPNVQPLISNRRILIIEIGINIYGVLTDKMAFYYDLDVN